jgi:glutamate/tyrosine decarboxylase-like PLP-dependent enzyme
MAGPRFFGFVIGGALPVTVASNWLATAWDQNAALQVATPGVSAIEQVALRWLLEILGLPPQSAGAFVTGGTVANFTALAAARHRVLANAGWDVEEQGMAGAPPLTVLVGEEAHPTLLKSLSLLGLGRATARRIPVDGQGRMRLDALEVPTVAASSVGGARPDEHDAKAVRARLRRIDGDVAKRPGGRHKKAIGVFTAASSEEREQRDADE